MSSARRVESHVPLFTYITVPPKSSSADDAEFDDLPGGIPYQKLHEDNRQKDTSTEEEEEARPFRSSILDEVATAHTLGQCNPCAYFWQKEDGCRLGADCNFCHTCDRDAMRRWKKEKKQRKKAEALAADKKAGNGKKKAAAQKSAGTVDPIIGDPVRVNLAECSGLSVRTPDLGTIFPYLPMELRLTPYQVPPGLDLEKTTATRATMSPKLIEGLSDPGMLSNVLTTGNALKAAQHETATHRPLRLYDMWPELMESMK